jgi:hypothetical protein
VKLRLEVSGVEAIGAEALVPPGDCPWGEPLPCLNGVSAESFPDHLRLTPQADAGWYRYSLRWEFYDDGTVMPTFGFGTYNTSCSGATHRHHAYWRFDFDIDDAGNDTVSQVGGSLSGPISQEAERTWEEGGVSWEVRDSVSSRGYRLTPGAQDQLLAVDTFSKNDLMVTLYHSSELSDSGGGCAINPGSIVNAAVVDTDVVMYYRGGVRDVVGPTSPMQGDGRFSPARRGVRRLCRRIRVGTPAYPRPCCRAVGPRPLGARGSWPRGVREASRSLAGHAPRAPRRMLRASEGSHSHRRLSRATFRADAPRERERGRKRNNRNRGSRSPTQKLFYSA